MLFKNSRLDLVVKCLTHTFLNGRGRPRISTKIHCYFHQKSVSGASDVPCRFWDTSTGSVTTAGTPQTFGDGMMIDTGRHTLDSCDFHSILEREQCNSLTAVVTKTTVLHEKITPNIPQTKNFDFFHVCKMFRVVYGFSGFVSRFCIFGRVSARCR